MLRECRSGRYAIDRAIAAGSRVRSLVGPALRLCRGLRERRRETARRPEIGHHDEVPRGRPRGRSAAHPPSRTGRYESFLVARPAGPRSAPSRLRPRPEGTRRHRCPRMLLHRPGPRLRRDRLHGCDEDRQGGDRRPFDGELRRPAPRRGVPAPGEQARTARIIRHHGRKRDRRLALGTGEDVRQGRQPRPSSTSCSRAPRRSTPTSWPR